MMMMMITVIFIYHCDYNRHNAYFWLMLYQHYTKGVSQLAIGQGPFVMMMMMMMIMMMMIIIITIIIIIIIIYMKRFSSGECYADFTPKERAIAKWPNVLCVISSPSAVQQLP